MELDFNVFVFILGDSLLDPCMSGLVSFSLSYAI